MKIALSNEQETEQLGAELWRVLPKECLIFLKGELGAGKTTLTRGVLRAAGYLSAVKSPTYTLVEEYQLGHRTLFHFDLYRISDPEELEWIGMRDYLEQQSLCFVEWPELGKGLLPQADIEITLKAVGDGREADIQVLSSKLVNKLTVDWKKQSIVL
ncbi:MAG: tRNA (adenosine(37)-N6)-threonylcarbamoyltransferase complex ATPase subunit type 1 TsaE [Methylococcales bacterium]|nr:tRNA (adenosine(37)-N6)-threonylcarbamoyltransferase complex ATPase subunit type 1 TsaE [Methylococcales bacterium]